MSSVLRFVAPPVLLVLSLAVIACGGSDKAEKTAPASSGTSETQDAASVKLTQCLREQGLDVPDAAGHEAFAGLSAADRSRLQAALQGPCSEFQSEAFSDAEDAQTQEFLDAITGFTVCLRKRSVDVPDPDPTNPFAVLHSLDRGDPRVAAAAAACQDQLAVLNGGG